jgi:hypothetical protein
VSGFTALLTNDDRLLVTRAGRTVAVRAGEPAGPLARGLSTAADEGAGQLLLARTGDYERGT